MTREEHKAIVNELLTLGNSEHQARVSELLTSLSEDYEKTLTESETLTSTNATLTSNNEKLRQVNADLFLKVGTSTPTNPSVNEKSAPQDEDNKLTYESLFNEKGELI